MRRLDSITDSTDMSLSKFQETVKAREACRATVHGVQRVRHILVTKHQQAFQFFYGLCFLCFKKSLFS